MKLSTHIYSAAEISSTYSQGLIQPRDLSLWFNSSNVPTDQALIALEAFWSSDGGQGSTASPLSVPQFVSTLIDQTSLSVICPAIPANGIQAATVVFPGAIFECFGAPLIDLPLLLYPHSLLSKNPTSLHISVFFQAAPVTPARTQPRSDVPPDTAALLPPTMALPLRFLCSQQWEDCRQSASHAAVGNTVLRGHTSWWALGLLLM